MLARLAFGTERPSSSHLHILSIEHDTARRGDDYEARQGHIESETQDSARQGVTMGCWI